MPEYFDTYRSQIVYFCRKWGVMELGIFGSFLRSDVQPDSDMDVLISFQKNAHRDLFDLIAMRDELQKIFGRDVDLIGKEGIRNPIRRAAILANNRVIYAAQG